MRATLRKRKWLFHKRWIKPTYSRLRFEICCRYFPSPHLGRLQVQPTLTLVLTHHHTNQSVPQSAYKYLMCQDRNTHTHTHTLHTPFLSNKLFTLQWWNIKASKVLITLLNRLIFMFCSLSTHNLIHVKWNTGIRPIKYVSSLQSINKK